MSSPSYARTVLPLAFAALLSSCFSDGGASVTISPLRDDARPTITGERLDAASPPVTVQNLGLTLGGYISGVVFAQAGCWHLRAVAAIEMLDAHVYIYPNGCIPSSHARPHVRGDLCRLADAVERITLAVRDGFGRITIR